MSTEKRYRTVVLGTLVQDTALTVGGGQGQGEPESACLRDGLGRLTLPATGLAGALVETAARVCPDLLPTIEEARAHGDRPPWTRAVTGKLQSAPERRPGEPELRFLQSVWSFENAHPADARGGAPAARTEWRQGAGIRQATGATAVEKGALYDAEAVPEGTRWSFRFEVDTARPAGDLAEALALCALEEWVRGRACLLYTSPSPRDGLLSRMPSSA